MISHDRRILLMALAAGLPAVVVAVALLGSGCGSVTRRVGVSADAGRAWSSSAGSWLSATALRDRLVRPLQTISNLLAALREGDFSIRARRCAVPTMRSAP